MSDLLRAHEGNPDTKPDDPSKIHWAKFNMIGKFIGNTSQYQAQCRDPNEYNFTENKVVAGLLDIVTMDYDVCSGSKSYSIPLLSGCFADATNPYQCTF